MLKHVALGFIIAAACCTPALAQQQAAMRGNDRHTAAEGAPLSGAPTLQPPADRPASMSDPSGVLSLATGGPAYLEPLPTRGSGCCLRPQLDCPGPDYCGCHRRMYYRTNPRDDDPVLPLYPSIRGPVGEFWYHQARALVLRKQHCSEMLDP